MLLETGVTHGNCLMMVKIYFGDIGFSLRMEQPKEVQRFPSFLEQADKKPSGFFK
jgi:hypothetical protein